MRLMPMTVLLGDYSRQKVLRAQILIRNLCEILNGSRALRVKPFVSQKPFLCSKISEMR